MTRHSTWTELLLLNLSFCILHKHTLKPWRNVIFAQRRLFLNEIGQARSKFCEHNAFQFRSSLPPYLMWPTLFCSSSGSFKGKYQVSQVCQKAHYWLRKKLPVRLHPVWIRGELITSRIITFHWEMLCRAKTRPASLKLVLLRQLRTVLNWTLTCISFAECSHNSTMNSAVSFGQTN